MLLAAVGLHVASNWVAFRQHLSQARGRWLIGAGALVMLEEYLAQVTEHWQIVLGPVLLLAVLFARRGILGLIEALPGDWMGRLRRWRARRSGDV